MGFAEDGFAIVPGVVDEAGCDFLIAALWRASESRRETYAIRNLLQVVPEVRAWAESSACRQLVEPILGERAMAVRGILFDKHPGANWKVPWHQDLSIAVEERIEIPGFGPWSLKAGVHHVQPPASLLEQMVAVRLHLDDCGAMNGPLRVIAGSHRNGRGVEVPKDAGQPVVCAVEKGGVILMRPLLWHASSPASAVVRRRVIHIEFAATALEGGLRWIS